jgi:uncharacterized RDD family membrane protein YckC
MKYCKNCGEEISRGAAFCPKCGARVERATDLVLATWGERLVAYIIDVVLLGIVVGWFSLPGFRWMPHMWGLTFPNWIPFVDFGFRNVVYFLYWMFLEQVYGQSVGKMAMKIKVADLDGRQVSMQQAAVQGIGKAFLLPLDCLLGWFLYPARQQRLFNYLSETVVLKKYD